MSIIAKEEMLSKIREQDKIIRAMAEELKDSVKCDYCHEHNNETCIYETPRPKCPTTDEIIKHFTNLEAIENRRKIMSNIVKERIRFVKIGKRLEAIEKWIVNEDTKLKGIERYTVDMEIRLLEIEKWKIIEDARRGGEEQKPLIGDYDPVFCQDMDEATHGFNPEFEPGDYVWDGKEVIKIVMKQWPYSYPDNWVLATADQIREYHSFDIGGTIMPVLDKEKYSEVRS